MKKDKKKTEGFQRRMQLFANINRPAADFCSREKNAFCSFDRLTKINQITGIK